LEENVEGEGEFIRHLDNNWGIAVFATKSMLEEWSMVQTLYFDGTFCTAPKPYHQIYNRAWGSSWICHTACVLSRNRKALANIGSWCNV